MPFLSACEEAGLMAMTLVTSLLSPARQSLFLSLHLNLLLQTGGLKWSPSLELPRSTSACEGQDVTLGSQQATL